MSDETLSHIDAEPTPVTRAPCVFLGIEYDRPLEPPAAFPLHRTSEITFGRGTERKLKRGRAMEIRLVDPWMSSRHARLARGDGGWVIEDLGSKNGTIVNGVPTPRAVLADGDVFEVGHALFLFRSDVEIREQDIPSTGELATFVAALSLQLDGLTRVATRPMASVMVSGESGTGKELVARTFHQLSGRGGAFVAVNCGSLPASLFEAELFGYRRGAFSGATEDHLGLVRAADKGTLFLDEIGDLSAASQAALLRVLQEHEVLPLGATRPIKVDIRLVTATHRDLGALTSSGQFRPDLYARLAGLRVILPPLRERREDLGLIVASLIRKLSPEPRRVKLTGRAVRALYRYDFPLNIRELEKALSTALALAGDGTIDLGHLPEPIRAGRPTQAVTQPLELDAEETQRRDELIEQLRIHEGNVARVAKAMGKAPIQIHRWAKRFGLDLNAYRPT